jgi:hypothetical protein
VRQCEIGNVRRHNGLVPNNVMALTTAVKQVMTFSLDNAIAIERDRAGWASIAAGVRWPRGSMHGSSDQTPTCLKHLAA